MESEIHFKKSVIAKLKVPPDSDGSNRRIEFRDPNHPYLLLRVSSSGRKSWCVYKKPRGSHRPIRSTLGTYPSLTIDEAVQLARAHTSEIHRGVNPNQKAGGGNAPTLREAFDTYLQNKRLKPRTAQGYRSEFEICFADWSGRPLSEISNRDVLERHVRRSKDSLAQADLAMRVLRAIFNYAAVFYTDCDGNPILGHNPVRALNTTRAWNRVPRKQRILKPDQLRVWWQTLDALASESPEGMAPQLRDYCRFLLLTGMRKSEGMRLQWKDVDLKHRSLLIKDPKNKRSVEIPLSSWVVEMLAQRKKGGGDSAYVFPGRVGSHMQEPKRFVGKVVQRSGIEWSFHDLRRTYLTTAESLNISYLAMKRLVNHTTAEHDVTAGYIPLDLERLRAPQELIATALLAHAGAKAASDAEVIGISRANRSKR